MRWALIVLLAGCDAGPGVDRHVDTDAAGPTDAPIAADAPVDVDAGREMGDVEVPVSIDPDTESLTPVEVGPNEHVTFFLAFEPPDADVELEVLRSEGAEPVHLATTDAGGGLRTLAVFDPSGPRTFWARITTTEASFSGTLAITRVPFADGATCAEDCAHLLQLPLPNDPMRDGYRMTSSTVFRYQYGRRDMIMFVRHAGQRMIELGHAPFVPADISQWDGETPGIDVGSPRHGSHQRGKDIDLSLYGQDGMSVFRTYCMPEETADGRECIAGTLGDLDAVTNAAMFGDFYATGRVTMCFLDQVLIDAVIPAADEAAAMGLIDPSLVPLYADGRHLQHWPNHDNHVHVRLSETEGAAIAIEGAPIEPP